MPDRYRLLLDAAIQHLENLKARGVRSVSVRRATLSDLQKAPPAIGRGSTPAVANLPAAVGQAPISSSATPSPRAARLETATASSTLAAPRGEARLVTSSPAPASSGSSNLDSQARAEAMKELRERALVCMKCPNLASSRKNVVFGVGDIQAQLMFVGEAPGAEEDAQGEPFVGAAGQLLTKIIQAMGLSRQAVYIGNILKCRPDTPGQSSGNRKPTLEEMKTCIPYLHSQIDLIQPRVLVALGGTAVEGLLGKTEGITRLRGHWQEYRDLPLMPTFHPSYLLRNQSLSEKRKVWEDMLQVMERLEMPISEKQRGYFLRA